MGKTKAFYDDGQVTIFCGDVRLLARVTRGDAILTVPPRGESRVGRDKWPQDWPKAVRRIAPSLWCVGSLRMFVRHGNEFSGWQVGQDVIWEHQQDSPAPLDGRIVRTHETIVHWYHGPWKDIYRQSVYIHGGARDRLRRSLDHDRQGPFKAEAVEQGEEATSHPLRSVIFARPAFAGANCAGSLPEQSSGSSSGSCSRLPESVLRLLIEHAVPLGGTLVDPFCGEGHILAIAKAMGRRAVGFDPRRNFCQLAAWRIAQDDLPMDSCVGGVDADSPSIAPSPNAVVEAEPLEVAQELFAV